MLVNGKRINAFLDTGSTKTSITKSLASSLNLKGNDFKYVLNTVSYAWNASSKLVTIEVASNGQRLSRSVEQCVSCVEYSGQISM